jgi:hypothetical protein
MRAAFWEAFMRAVFLGLLLVSPYLPAFADDPPKPASGPEPISVVVSVKAGDSWGYEFRDGITNDLISTVQVTVTQVAEGEIDVRNRVAKVKTNDENSTLIVFDRNWRLKDNGKFKYTPFSDDTGIPDGLAVGKSWTYTRVNSRLTRPQDFKFIGTGKVTAWERITLPSGAVYDAYRIDFTETQTPVVNNRKLEQTVVEWFAPSVNRFVQLTWEARQNGKLSDKTLQFLTEYKPLP